MLTPFHCIHDTILQDCSVTKTPINTIQAILHHTKLTFLCVPLGSDKQTPLGHLLGCAIWRSSESSGINWSSGGVQTYIVHRENKGGSSTFKDNTWLFSSSFFNPLFAKSTVCASHDSTTASTKVTPASSVMCIDDIFQHAIFWHAM